MISKVIKNIKLSWKWQGDTYLLRGFNIRLMKQGDDPNQVDEALAQTNISIKSNSDSYSYKFSNLTLDKDIILVPWIQALYDNDDSDWASLDGALIEDDGNATIVVIGNPTFQQVIDMATDSKITPQEKLSLIKEWDEIVTDHYVTLLGAVKADLPSNNQDLMNYDMAIDSLAAYLNYNKEYTFHPLDHKEFTYPVMLTDNLTTDLNTGHYGGYEKYKKMFSDFYEAKVTLLETIKDKILENNNSLIQEEIDKSTLPDTITIGGYTTGNFEPNKNYDSLTQLGTIKVGSGHFITTTGQRFKIETPEEIVTNLASNKTRFKYILFVGADKTRFVMADEKASKNYVSALPKNGKWWYFDGANDTYKEFNPIPEDCVVAKIEEHNSSSNEMGIRAIKFMANTQESVFNQLTDNGEQQFIGKDENGRLFINGEYIQAHTIKGNQIIANGFKAVSTEDGRTTVEITETGEAYLDLKNFTLRAGGNINIKGVVNFESLDTDMQGNFSQVDGKTVVNGDAIKTGTITANNNKSEFNLNDGRFRLGGTGLNDYKLYFDGENLNFGEGAIQWPEMPDIPNLEELENHSVSLSKDTLSIRIGKDGLPQENEIGLHGLANSTVSVFKGSNVLTAVAEDTETLTNNQFKYVITNAQNCIAKRKSDSEFYIEELLQNTANVNLSNDVANVGTGQLNSNLTDNGYIDIDVICGENKQTFKKRVSFVKIRVGEDGNDGMDGSQGEAAKYIRITGEQVFKYDTLGSVDKESISLKATTYNFNATNIIWEVHDGVNWVEASGINNQQVYKVTPNSEDWKDRTSIRYRCIINSYYLDEITVSKVIDGLNGSDGSDGVGYTIILSNEAHTIACDENGNPNEGEVGPQGLAKTDITAYKNATELKPIRVVGGDYSQMREGEFCVEIIEQVGCVAKMGDADTVYIESMNSNSGYINLNVICEKQSIAIKKMSLTKAIKGVPGQNGQDGKDGIDGIGSYIAVLTNDFHSIPTDENGQNGNYNGCETSISLYYGDEVMNCTYKATTSEGITGTLTDNKYKVTNMSTMSGYVDMTAIYNSKEYTKRFTLSKTKSGTIGQDGENATVYWLATSASVIHKDKNNILNPRTITFESKKQTGEESVKAYPCRFKIYTSTNGSTFTESYASTIDESNKSFSIPSNVTYIRCQMYKAGGFDTILDEERIPVISDGEKGEQGPVGPQGPPGQNGSDANVPGWVQDWDRNSTTINGQSMLSPRIFAGVGGSSATGVALGRQALGVADNTSTIGMGIYGNGNLIGKIKSTPDSNGVVVEFGTGATKMTIDKYGNVSAPKMSASEIVSSINGGSTTINGDMITTNTINVDHIAPCSDNAILKLFKQNDGSYCSIDASYKDEIGKGSSIRVKWDSLNYMQVGRGETSYFRVYLGDGHYDDSDVRLNLDMESFNVIKNISNKKFSVNFRQNYTSIPGFEASDCNNPSIIIHGGDSYSKNTSITLRNNNNGNYLKVVDTGITAYNSYNSIIPINFSCNLVMNNNSIANASDYHLYGGGQFKHSSSGYPALVYGSSELEIRNTGAYAKGEKILTLNSYEPSANITIGSLSTGRCYLGGYLQAPKGTVNYLYPDRNRGGALGSYEDGTVCMYRTIHGQYIWWETNGGHSDVTLKKDIEYIQRNELEKGYDKPNKYSEEDTRPTFEDFYNFMKDEYSPVTFKYKSNQEGDLLSNQIGFIANEIADSKIGQLFVDYDEINRYYVYNVSGYMSIIATALKESIHKQEQMKQNNEILRQDIDILKKEIEDLKNLINGGVQK